jgi:hypothetical protein
MFQQVQIQNWKFSIPNIYSPILALKSERGIMHIFFLLSKRQWQRTGAAKHARSIEFKENPDTISDHLSTRARHVQPVLFLLYINYTWFRHVDWEGG